MKITNNYRLPEQYLKLCQSDYKPTEGVYSVTTILKDNKEMLLSRRHNDEITQDCIDMAWLVFGTAVHMALESVEEAPDELKETYLKVPTIDGYYLSGKQDLYNESEKKIIDWKTASVNKIRFDDWADYEKQINYYAWMFSKLGFEVKKGEIVAFLKDWNTNEAKRNRDYPQHPIYVKRFDITPESLQQAEDEIIAKFESIKQAEQLADDDIPPCSEEARWYAGTTYAVMETGKKRAIRVFNSENEAWRYLTGSNKKNAYIQKRTGENKKCENYCSCKNFCNFYKYLKTLKNEEE